MQSCFDIVSIRVLVYKFECKDDTVESIILWIEETEKKTKTMSLVGYETVC